MALRIGLTGGIGSGKSMVAKVFELLGVPVYYADQEAKHILNKSSQAKSAIIAAFGENAYSNGTLNRSYIASIVFNNKEKLDILNAIVHPLTIADSEQWMQSQNTHYAIKEAALIFESGVNIHLDYIIGVSAPLPLRVQRVIERDTISAQDVHRRIENQMKEEEKLKLCDFIIVNDEEHLVVPQVLDVHQRLTDIALSMSLQQIDKVKIDI